MIWNFAELGLVDSIHSSGSSKYVNIYQYYHLVKCKFFISEQIISEDAD